MLTKRSAKEIKEIQSEKNNNEFIYQTNQSINSLKDSITSLSLQFEKERGERGSQLQELRIQVENHVEDSTKKMMGIFNEIEMFRSQIYKFGFYLNSIESQISEIKYSVERTDRDIEHCREEILEQGKDADRVINGFKNVSDDYQRRLVNACEVLRTELKVVKPKLDPLEVKLNEQINIMKVDHQGIYKDIHLMKRSIDYSEKKIEAIFDKIGMKSAGKPSV